jgi:glyoxylase-like metal-dependent hydrolase (beta-lactamase superfamily II)
VKARVDHAVTSGTFSLDGSFSDFGTIITSIRERLLILPDETAVHPGHGDSTTIAAEAPALPDWIARGH